MPYQTQQVVVSVDSIIDTAKFGAASERNQRSIQSYKKCVFWKPALRFSSPCYVSISTNHLCKECKKPFSVY